MTRGIKDTNEYARCIAPEIYEAMPKSVFAAIAVSYGTHGGDEMSLVNHSLMLEWKILYDGGIVPQKPPTELLSHIIFENEEEV